MYVFDSLVLARPYSSYWIWYLYLPLQSRWYITNVSSLDYYCKPSNISHLVLRCGSRITWKLQKKKIETEWKIYNDRIDWICSVIASLWAFFVSLWLVCPWIDVGRLGGWLVYACRDMVNANGFAIYANLMLTMYYSRPQALCTYGIGTKWPNPKANKRACVWVEDTKLENSKCSSSCVAVGG